MKYSKANIIFNETRKELRVIYHYKHNSCNNKLYSNDEYLRMSIIRRTSCFLKINFQDLIHIIRKDD